MRVLYFGTYERDYPRNAQVISCLRRAGVDVHERHEAVWDGRRDNWKAGAADAARLALAEARLLRRPHERYDAVVVGYPGHFDLPGPLMQPAFVARAALQALNDPETGRAWVVQPNRVIPFRFPGIPGPR